MSDWIVAVFLGDSLTTGFQQGPGYLPPRYYPFTNMLESSIRMRLIELKVDKDLVIVNEGIDGDTTIGMLERFNCSVDPENPDIVLLWGGINDLSTRRTPDEVLTNIVELVRRVKEIGAMPVVLNVAPVSGIHFNDTVNDLNTLTRNYCTKNNVVYLDVFSQLVDAEGKLAKEYSNNGIHLSDKGYRKIMIPIFHALLKILEEKL